MPGRIRTPGAPASAQVAVEITVPELARACGWSRQTALRRLHAAGVKLHRRGFGSARAHYAVTLDDLVGSDLAGIVSALDYRKLLLERGAPRPSGDGEDE